MRGLINAVRSILFNIVFYIEMIIFVLIVGPLCLLPSDKAVRAGIKVLSLVVLFTARWIMGIRLEVRGREKLPPIGEPCILLSKHMSNMDPFMTFLLRLDLTALAKKELFKIPLIGTILSKIKVVRIDRGAGNAHRGMDKAADMVVTQKQALLIYPEATRVKPGQQRRLKAGAFFMQEGRHLPVFPIAMNTGCHWSRGFWHTPGHVVVEVGDKIPEGLDRQEFLDAAQERVVRRSDELMREQGAILPPFEEQPVIGH